MPFSNKLLCEASTGKPDCCAPPALWNARFESSAEDFAMRSCSILQLDFKLLPLSSLTVFPDGKIRYQ